MRKPMILISSLPMVLQVLKVVSMHKDVLKADSLQQLHALHNLASLLDPSGKLPQGVVPTLRDASLQKDADQIREVSTQQWQDALLHLQTQEIISDLSHLGFARVSAGILTRMCIKTSSFLQQAKNAFFENCHELKSDGGGGYRTAGLDGLRSHPEPKQLACALFTSHQPVTLPGYRDFPSLSPLFPFSEFRD